MPYYAGVGYVPDIGTSTGLADISMSATPGVIREVFADGTVQTSTVVFDTSTPITCSTLTASSTVSAPAVQASGLTANTALIAGASKNLASSSVSSTELACLSGVASNVQSQIDSKLPLAGGTLTGDLTVVSGGTGTVNAGTVHSGSDLFLTVGTGKRVDMTGEVRANVGAQSLEVLDNGGNTAFIVLGSTGAMHSKGSTLDDGSGNLSVGGNATISSGGGVVYAGGVSAGVSGNLSLYGGNGLTLTGDTTI